MSGRDYELSIVIPVYNETGRIEAGLTRIKEFARGFAPRTQIVVYDDGSRDDTVAKARALLADFPDHVVMEGHANRGKGFAIRHAMMRASGAVRLFTDIDLSVPIENAVQFHERVASGVPVVIGSRKMAGSHIDVRQPYYRELLGGVFRWTSRMIFAPPVTDFTCGFKAFSARASEAIFPQGLIDRWTFDAEILFLAYRMGFAIHQIPVYWANSEDSRVRVGIDAAYSFYEMALIRWYHLVGRYNTAIGPTARG